MSSVAPAARQSKKIEKVPEETLESLTKRSSKFVPVELTADVTGLKEKDRKALNKVIETSFGTKFEVEVHLGRFLFRITAANLSFQEN